MGRSGAFREGVGDTLFDVEKAITIGCLTAGNRLQGIRESMIATMKLEERVRNAGDGEGGS